MKEEISTSRSRRLIERAGGRSSLGVSCQLRICLAPEQKSDNVVEPGLEVIHLV